MENPVADLRTEYAKHGLTEAEAALDPFRQFDTWFRQALEAQVPEPNAMTLATVGVDGKPSARIVLLKGFDARGFVFFTNYESRKGQELAQNPNAALVFWWQALERQVRVEGTVEQVTEAESDAYFRSRPEGSRLGAWVSRQSAVIPGRAVLEEQLRELRAAYEGREIPRPAYWGGFRVRPERVEFWQGRPSRLHDRLRYRLAEGAWHRERLAP